MNELWQAFQEWVDANPPDVEIESVFMCICPDGEGWIGDGAGAVPVEFESIEDGIKWFRAHLPRPEEG